VRPSIVRQSALKEIAQPDRLLDAWIADRREQCGRTDETPAEPAPVDESRGAVDEAFAELGTGLRSLERGRAI